MLIHEDAHKLGNDERGVGVVYLDGVVLGEALYIAPLAHVLAHDVLRRGGDEEVLLLEAQSLALNMLIRGVEHLGDDLGHGALLHALDILALGEEVHVQRVGAFCIPQAQVVYLLAAVARDEHVARHGDDGGVAGVLGGVVAEVIPMRGDLPAEADLNGVLIARHQPALRGDAPVVGDLCLLSVGELLLEYAQLIADGVPRGLQPQRGHTVHIARGEAAQTAVAETGVRLGLKYVGRIAPHILQRAGDGLGNAEVEGVLHKTAPHEELHGHIVHFLHGMTRILRHEKAAHDLTYDYGRGLKKLRVGRLAARNAEMGAELILYGAANLVA